MRATLAPHGSRAPRGFTLVEIMVTLGIIVLLVGILIPVVTKARRVAAYTAAKRNLESIRVALDEYKNVWHIYPPVTPLPNTFNTSAADSINNIDGLPIVMDNGAHALYSALMLRGNVRVSRSKDSSGNIVVGGTAGYGPFLNHEQMKVAPDNYFTSTYSQIPNGTPLFLCDTAGRPILYVPAAQIPVGYTKTNSIPTPTNPYVASASSVKAVPLYDFDAIPIYVPDPNDASAKVNPFHNMTYSSTPTGVKEMQFIMGDTNMDGIIDTTKSPPEQPAYTGPYLLWSAGADGNFGINPSTKKTDDVTNFDMPGSVREN